MEKVKLTQEQAEAIERIKRYNDSGIDERIIRSQIDGEWIDPPFSSLGNLSIKEFLDAIYIGYEVELDIKEGDYVVNENGTIGIVKEIKKVRYGGLLTGRWLTGTKSVMSCPISFIERLATDEEIIFAKKGREVWELKKGDILQNKITCKLFEVDNQINEKTHFVLCDRPVNLGAIKRAYVLTCFAEDRQDV